MIVTIYAVGCGVTLGAVLVIYSIVCHREELGLESPSERDWSDFWLIVCVTVLWPLIPVPLLGYVIHAHVIGPLVKRACAGELMKKRMERS